MFHPSTGKWLVASSLLLALAPSANAAPDAAALLLAQLDSVAAFCSQHFPANKDQYRAFVDSMLSGAMPQELARTRDTDGYENARQFDMSQLNASGNDAAAICSGLTPQSTQ